MISEPDTDLKEAKKTVLVVDNVEFHLDKLEEFLTRKGYSVVTADSAAKAKAVLDRSAIDLAVVDVRLEDDYSELDFSGIEFARTTAPEVPKVMVTSYDGPEAARRALGEDYEGLPAVGFAFRSRGLSGVAQAVKVGLAPPDDPFVQASERIFGATDPVKIPNRVQEVPSEEALRRFQSAVAQSRSKLEAVQDETRRRISHYHVLSVGSILVGLLALVSALILLLRGEIEVGAVVAVGGIATQALVWMKSRRHASDQAEFEAHLDRWLTTDKLGAVIDLVMALGPDESQKKRLIDKAIDLL